MQIPPVYLNHLYIRLEPETYNEITESDLLRNEFSSHEMRTTWSSKTTSWTGIYFYGDNTYLEFQAAETTAERGNSGIAFGVDEPGDLDKVQSRLENKIAARFSPYQAKRRIDGSYIPWFRSCRRDDRLPSSILNSWVMEYNPEFLKLWYPSAGHTTPAGDVSRSSVLTRYATRIESTSQRSYRYFKDVLGITVALDSIEGGRFLEELDAYGYEITSDGRVSIARRPELTVKIVPCSPEIKGITRIVMALHRNKDGLKRYEFGSSSVLEFIDNATAVWSFR